MLAGGGDMECPKCGYLGFEDTPRCRNCSYDFALAAAASDVGLEDIDRAISQDLDSGAVAQDPRAWPDLGRLDAIEQPAGVPAVFDVSDLDALLTKAESAGLTALNLPTVALPEEAPPAVRIDPQRDAFAQEASAEQPPVLFNPEMLSWPTSPAAVSRSVSAPSEWDVAPVEETSPRARQERPALEISALDDDAPLVRLQRPRAPVSVRKTPMSPKLRAVSRTTPQEPGFDFLEAALSGSSASSMETEDAVDRDPLQAEVLEASPALRRLAAAAIDGVLFVGIDLAVVYFTFRIVGVAIAEWRIIPLWPLLAFLCAMKLVYASVFTAMGGQTIGKMAAGIRVVSMEDRAVTGAAAFRRTLATIVALATAGVGYLPALIGDRRAVHDRLSGTRVVLSPAA